MSALDAVSRLVQRVTNEVHQYGHTIIGCTVHPVILLPEATDSRLSDGIGLFISSD